MQSRTELAIETSKKENYVVFFCQSMAGTIHFILGHSAAASLRRAFPDANIVRMTDPYSHGRCRFAETNSVGDWLRARHRWWQETEGANSREAQDSGANLITAFETAIADIEDAVLWFADNATERLHVCWLAAVLPAQVRMKLAVPPHRSGGRSIQNIGVVHSDTLAKTVLRELPPSERSELAELWFAFTKPCPEVFFAKLQTLVPTDIGHALLELRRRFPGHLDGLTHWEQRILKAVADNPGKPCTNSICSFVFGEWIDHPSDSTLHEFIYLFEELGFLKEIPPDTPKVAQHYTHPTLGEIQSVLDPEYFYITPLGEDVLKGKRNRVTIAGFDRWFGGTHVSSEEQQIWWYTEESTLLFRPAQ